MAKWKSILRKKNRYAPVLPQSRFMSPELDLNDCRAELNSLEGTQINPATFIFKVDRSFVDNLPEKRQERLPDFRIVQCLLFLENKGLCTLEADEGWQQGFWFGERTQLKAKITTLGLERIILSRKTNKPIVISEVDEVAVGWARIGRYFQSLLDEFMRATVRYFVPGMIAGLGAGLSASWFLR